MTFLSNEIAVLKVFLLLLFAMLLLILLYYFLVQAETNFSSSKGEKVDLISLLFPLLLILEICLYLYFLLHFYFCRTFHFLLLLLLLFSYFSQPFCYLYFVVRPRLPRKLTKFPGDCCVCQVCQQLPAWPVKKQSRSSTKSKNKVRTV